MKSLKGMKKNTLNISYTLAALFMLTACNEVPIKDSEGNAQKVLYNQSCWPDINYELAKRDNPINKQYFEYDDKEERVYDFYNGERVKAIYSKMDDSCEITLIMW